MRPFTHSTRQWVRARPDDHQDAVPGVGLDVVDGPPRAPNTTGRISSKHALAGSAGVGRRRHHHEQSGVHGAPLVGAAQRLVEHGDQASRGRPSGRPCGRGRPPARRAVRCSKVARPFEQRRHDEVVLRGEVAVDGADHDIGTLGDVLHLEVLVGTTLHEPDDHAQGALASCELVRRHHLGSERGGRHVRPLTGGAS